MNVTMRLTLDGLLRALRGQAHSAAEEIATIRAEHPRPPERPERSSREEPDGQPRR